jgi:uncharacterized protein
MGGSDIMQRNAIIKIHPDLPIYRIATAERSLIYIPGKVADIAPEWVELLQIHWQDPLCVKPDPFIQKISAWFEGHARDLANARLQWLNEPFMPQCLTVYLSNFCNLRCPYCFASEVEDRSLPGGGDKRKVVSTSAVGAAARLVAKNCAQRRTRFVLVLHGGGEPTIQWRLLKSLVHLTQAVAQQYDVPWFGYIATNGVMSESQALWVGQHFDVVGLSCDGPPDIQNSQRFFRNGTGSSAFVERAARIIRDAGASVEVRSTITPEIVDRQAEIVSYLYRDIGASTVRLLPVYCSRRRSESQFGTDDADRFVTHFLEAQDMAASLGRSLIFSGVRPNELHGPYCDVLRNVLRLTSDGTATACFYSIGGHDPIGRQLKIGNLNGDTGEFALDVQKIETFKQQAGTIPVTCRECINCYSCTRACPDFCSLLSRGWGESSLHELQGKASSQFLCSVYKKLSLAWILNSAKGIVKSAMGMVPSKRLVDHKDPSSPQSVPYLDDARVIISRKR